MTTITYTIPTDPADAGHAALLGLDIARTLAR
jgi:hypothetical protein